MEKPEILEFCKQLPEDFDRECVFQTDFEEALLNQVTDLPFVACTQLGTTRARADGASACRERVGR